MIAKLKDLYSELIIQASHLEEKASRCTGTVAISIHNGMAAGYRDSAGMLLELIKNAERVKG